VRSTRAQHPASLAGCTIGIDTVMT